MLPNYPPIPVLELAGIILDLEAHEHVPSGDRRTLAQYQADEDSDIARLAREVIRLDAIARQVGPLRDAISRVIRSIDDGPGSFGELQANELRALLAESKDAKTSGRRSSPPGVAAVAMGAAATSCEPNGVSPELQRSIDRTAGHERECAIHAPGGECSCPARFDEKSGRKRWAGVRDEEAKPLTDEQLATRTPAYQRGYRAERDADTVEAVTVKFTQEEPTNG